MTEAEYLELGQFIWANYVPKSGQADTIQGELLRSVVKLRDEAERNGNINWDDGHIIFAEFIRASLSKKGVLSENEILQLNEDIDLVLDYKNPQTSGAVFDRLERLIFDWYTQNQEPIPREINPDLKR